jgi:hypothetical protein
MFVVCFEYEIRLECGRRVEEVERSAFVRTKRGVGIELVWRSVGMWVWSEDNFVCVCVCVCVRVRLLLSDYRPFLSEN